VAAVFFIVDTRAW